MKNKKYLSVLILSTKFFMGTTRRTTWGIGTTKATVCHSLSTSSGFQTEVNYYFKCLPKFFQMALLNGTALSTSLSRTNSNLNFILKKALWWLWRHIVLTMEESHFIFIKGTNTKRRILSTIVITAKLLSLLLIVISLIYILEKTTFLYVTRLVKCLAPFQNLILVSFVAAAIYSSWISILKWWRYS